MNINQSFFDKNGILASITEKSEIILELGCGPQKIFPAAIGIDMIDSPAVDIVADVNQGLKFIPDNSIDKVFSSHFLEHLDHLELVMSEIFRVLKPGGIHAGLVPHFSNPYYYSDYTHKTPFGLYSFSYFSKINPFKRKVPVFYNSLDFELKKIKIVFYSPFLFINIFRKMFSWIFNSSQMMQEYYEGSWSNIIAAHEIAFEMVKKTKQQ